MSNPWDTYPVHFPTAWYAACRACGETFNPADERDMLHIQRMDGTECGGLARGAQCQWFATCDNDAIGVSSTPWGEVPICQRCATLSGAAIQGGGA